MDPKIIEAYQELLMLRFEYEIAYGRDFWWLTKEDRLIRVLTKKLELLVEQKERYRPYGIIEQ